MELSQERSGTKPTKEIEINSPPSSVNTAIMCPSHSSTLPDTKRSANITQVGPPPPVVVSRTLRRTLTIAAKAIVPKVMMPAGIAQRRKREANNVFPADLADIRRQTGDHHRHTKAIHTKTIMHMMTISL